MVLIMYLRGHGLSCVKLRQSAESCIMGPVETEVLLARFGLAQSDVEWGDGSGIAKDLVCVGFPS